MVHFLLRLAAFDLGVILVFHYSPHFNGWFEKTMAGFVLAWLLDPAMKKAAPFVYTGWMRLYRWTKK